MAQKFLNLAGLQVYDTAIKAWVEGKGYLTEHQDLSAYTIKSVKNDTNAKVLLTNTNGEVSADLSLAVVEDIAKGVKADKAWAAFLTGITPSTYPDSVIPTLKTITDSIDAITNDVESYAKNAVIGTDDPTYIDVETGKREDIDGNEWHQYTVNLTQKTIDAITLAETALQSIKTKEGESLIEITGTGADKEISSKEALTTAVGKANSAIQNITAGEYIGVEKDGTSVNIYADICPIENAGGETNGLVLAGDVKSKLDSVATRISELNATTLKMSGDTNASSIADEITDLKNSVAGGVHFRGVYEEMPVWNPDVDWSNMVYTFYLPSDPGATIKFQAGDVIILAQDPDLTGELDRVPTYEYILTTNDNDEPKWVELGETTSEGQRISALETGKLDKTAQAADSAKLGGQLPSYYASKADLDSYALKTDIPVAYTPEEVTAGISAWFSTQV